MNTRICSVIAAVTIMSLSSGCSGVRNFLFGRGARCGLCTSVTPQFGNTTQAPCGAVPYAPTCQTPTYSAPLYNTPCSSPCTAPCNAPTCQEAVTFPSGCGCNDCSGGQVYSSMPCGTCGGCETGTMGNCGCSAVADSYGPVVSDPYQPGQVVEGGHVMSEPIMGQPMMGQPIMGEQIMGGSVGSQPYATPGAPIQEDDFSARKFDADGNRILWEEPLPEGTTAL